MLYWLIKVVLTPILFMYFRIHVAGREHVPNKGGAIIAANHISFLDSILVPASILRRITYVAKAEYFDKWRTRWFFQGVGQIPIRRDGYRAADAALSTALDVLTSGKLLGIYPEGTRSPDGRCHRGRTGVARLALESGVPLVPVGISGTDKALPKGSLLPRPARVTIRFGAPIDVDRYRAWPDRRAACRALVDELMHEICRLSGQEFVDVYARRAPAAQEPVAA
jgi:1-acyl-sn-glycerol-3-phosphate acyltransferase